MAIKNTFREDLTITNLIVRNEKGDSVASSRESKERGEEYRFNLPAGKYSIFFSAGATRASMKEYRSFPALISLERRKSEKDIFTVKSHFDFEPVKK